MSLNHFGARMIINRWSSYKLNIWIHISADLPDFRGISRRIGLHQNHSKSSNKSPLIGFICQCSEGYFKVPMGMSYFWHNTWPHPVPQSRQYMAVLINSQNLKDLQGNGKTALLTGPSVPFLNAKDWDLQHLGYTCQQQLDGNTWQQTKTCCWLLFLLTILSATKKIYYKRYYTPEN